MENEEKVDQQEEAKEIDVNAENTPQTDNLTAETDTTTRKNGLFSKKNHKDKNKIQELEAEIEKLKAEKAELNDRFLRLYSEFDNYKKRANKEKLDILSTASEKVIVSLLPVIDDFERAIAANEKVEDIKAIKDGFILIYNKLIQLLKRFDVEEIQAKGEVFNTDFHEAVTHFPTEKEEDKGKVIDVTEKGYKLKDKVIRYAKVVVGQ
ncbi:MAG: nucleotide exchange factor GrpE [Bacteroidales bacterium]|nr:nucleotide exchange factor GrpE [Bacteroidales bacterium]